METGKADRMPNSKSSPRTLPSHTPTTEPRSFVEHLASRDRTSSASPSALTSLDAALWWAEARREVLVRTTTTPTGFCSCGNLKCSFQGRHFHGPGTNNKTALKDLLSRYPDSPIAVATGVSANLLAIDIDGPAGGCAWLAERERLQGALPRTPTIKIGDSGGFILLFEYPAGAKILRTVDVAEGVRVYGEAAQITVPPSPYKNGTHYEWAVDPNEVPCAEAPRWLAQAITASANGVAPAVKRRFEFIGADELEAEPAVPMLIDPVLPSGALASLIGAPASGKSFVALDLSMCVATGTEWHGHAVRQGMVLYVLAEGVGNFPKRMTAWRQVRTIPNPVAIKFLRTPVQFADGRDANDFLAAIRALGEAPALIVIDTMARCFVGGEENSAKEVGVFIASLERLRVETGATVLLVHHTVRKEARERGSSALAGAADTMIVVKKHGNEKHGDVVTITCGKQKDAPPFSTLWFHMHEVDLGAGNTSCVLVPTAPEVKPPRAKLAHGQENALRILAGFGESGATMTDWRRAAHIPDAKESTFRNWANAFVNMGCVAKSGTGKGAIYVASLEAEDLSANRSPLPGGAAVAAEEGNSANLRQTAEPLRLRDR